MSFGLRSIFRHTLLWLLLSGATFEMQFTRATQAADVDSAQRNAGTYLVMGEPLELVIGEAKLVQLDSEATDVIVGDPRILAMSLVHPGLIILTPLSRGSTNLLAVNKNTKELILNTQVSVVAARGGQIKVFRSLELQKYDCEGTFCEGDGTPYPRDLTRRNEEPPADSDATSKPKP